MLGKPYDFSGIQSHDAAVHIGSVTLRARDMATLARYYESVIGLERLDAGKERISLGSGGEAYLHLVSRPDATPDHASSAGLFHTAFLLPSRSSLGAWFKGASERGAAFDGASDHDVSEAFYLTDPEGNGIEVYADRPKALWRRDGEGTYLTTEWMDLRAVIAAAASQAAGNGHLPPDSRIGHVHLRVGDIPAAEGFYSSLFGLEIEARRPGGAFYAWSGYHHHLATNVWGSAGAGRRDGRSTGLENVELTVRDPALFAELAARLPADAATTGPALRVADPWGTELTFRMAS